MQSTSRVSRIRRSLGRQPKLGEKTVGWNLTTPPPPHPVVLDSPGTPVLKCIAFFNKTLCSCEQFHFILTSVWPLFVPRGLRKRSISPIQGEQGTGESAITDGWSHYSYPDSTCSKKMRTDGVCVNACFHKHFPAGCLLKSTQKTPWERKQVASSKPMRDKLTSLSWFT